MIRTILDLGILLSRQVLVAFLVLGGLLALLGWLRPALLPGWSPRHRMLVTAGCCLLAAFFLGIGLWYLTIEGFAGEVEPLVISNSWLLEQGQELYHPLDGANQYSVLYGPSVFLTNGLFLKVLGPTLTSAKLASVLAAFASVLFLLAAVSRKRNDPLAWAVVGCAVLLFWSHGFGIYLVRPDSLLVFAVALGIFLVRRAGSRLGVAGLAAVLGFAINLKVHGGLYFLPILYLAYRRWGRTSLVWIMGGAMLAVAAPFLLHPRISFLNYLAWLGNATLHGLTAQDLGLNLRFAFLLLLPLLGLAARTGFRSGVWRGQRGLLLWVFLALGPVLVLAAKPGAGPVHLLPFVPVMAFVPALVWSAARPADRALPSSRRVPARGLLAGAALTIVIAGMVSEYRATMLVAWQQGQAPGLAAEVRGIMAKYPGRHIGMACGGENAAFRWTWIRPLLVFADHPVLIDPISVMDCCLAGRPLPPATQEALGQGVVDLWLVPREQTPFAKVNWYPPHDPIFTPEFQQEFLAHHAKADRTEHFDLWFWKKDEVQALPGRPDWANAANVQGEVLAP